MFGILQAMGKQVQGHTTGLGTVWYILIFGYRLFVVSFIGGSVYGDEQGNFRCSQQMIGCHQFCFNQYTKISQIRFWAYQIIAVSTPTLFFHLYITYTGTQIQKLEAAKMAVKELEKLEKEEEKEKEKKDGGGEKEDDKKKDKKKSGKDEKDKKEDKDEKKKPKKEKKERPKTAEEKMKERLQLKKQVFYMEARKRKIGAYKMKQVVRGSETRNVPQTAKIIFANFVSLTLRLAMEILFIHLGANLYNIQEFRRGVPITWTQYWWNRVPGRYLCMEHENPEILMFCGAMDGLFIPCTVPRFTEKTFLLRYMNTIAFISVFITVYEIVALAIRTFRHRRSSNRLRKENLLKASTTPIVAAAAPDDDVEAALTTVNETTARKRSNAKGTNQRRTRLPSNTMSSSLNYKAPRYTSLSDHRSDVEDDDDHDDDHSDYDYVE